MAIQNNYNIDKSNFIHFRNVKKKQSEIKFHIGNDDLSYTSSYKYLGIILDEHLRFDKAIEELACSANRALGAVISKYKSNRNMSFEVYKKLFNTCVEPILTYCAPIWQQADCSKLDQVQCKAIRVFLGLHRFAPILGIIGDSGWDDLSIQRNIECFRFWNRLIAMNDERITKKIFLYDYKFSSTNGCWSNKLLKA